MQCKLSNFEITFEFAFSKSFLRRSCKLYYQGHWLPHRDNKAQSRFEGQGQLYFPIQSKHFFAKHSNISTYSADQWTRYRGLSARVIGLGMRWEDQVFYVVIDRYVSLKHICNMILRSQYIWRCQTWLWIVHVLLQMNLLYCIPHK
jgi:hypothetical protein